MICGKTIYETSRLAIEAIKGMLGDMDGRSRKQPSRAYFCEDCNGYHVHTENKPKKQKSNSQEVNTESVEKKYNDRKFKTLIIHEARKFKVK